MLVREAMTSEPLTATLRTTVKEALVTLSEHGITALPVVDRSGRLRGIVSELDLIEDAIVRDPRAREHAIAVDPLRPPQTVEDVYTRSAVTVAPDDDIAVAVELMTATGAKSLPVVERGHRLVGVVSRSDIVRALARTDAVIASDVTALLSSVGRADWLVEVDDGVVLVTGPANVGEASLARVVAQTVAGVVHVDTAPG
ncbi:CBS domain-containing protein [Nocardioides mangrovi]|uniref:CBS domain-containing protein n=1 Tax=Nocardioides mangrovi TaxID=2874580 RepID=A0ABS7U7L8_9ACTN|nr:CBS domain-containing protein [Nocardioides mangrovi]MBZ5736960.1 CBS domain-containing protein [Nocardioides mangrovi]